MKKDNILRITEDRMEGWSHDFVEFSILAIPMIKMLYNTAHAQSAFLHKDLPTFNAAFIEFQGITLLMDLMDSHENT